MLGCPPPPHVSPAVHPPQSIRPPHPSLTKPQRPAQAAAWLSGAQVIALDPQRSCTPPPPQVSGAAQVVPQPVRRPPQPSLTGPQCMGSTSTHVKAVHVAWPHRLCSPPPPQVSPGPLHPPQ